MSDLLRLAVLACVGGLGACATQPPPPPVYHAVAENGPVLRSIAIVAKPPDPEVPMAEGPAQNASAGDPPAVSAARGAAAGAAAGAALGAMYGLAGAAVVLLLTPAGWVMLPGIAASVAVEAAVGAGVVGLAGGIAGIGIAQKPQPVPVVPVADAASVRGGFDEALATSTLQALQRFTTMRAALLAGDAARRPGDDVDGVLDVRVDELGFVEVPGTPPQFVLLAIAGVSERLTGAEESRARSLFYRSEPHAMSAWSADSGALAKREVERAHRALGERIVDVFYLPPIGTSPPPGRNACGLVPVAPPLAQVPGFAHDTRVEPVRVESVTPRLAWQPPIAHLALADVRYDLRIWNASTGDLVHERIGLDRSEHVVDVPLAPGTLHWWSVRSRYQAEGRQGATPWSASNVPMFPRDPATRHAAYVAGPAAARLRPDACTRDASVYPCACLDNLPAANRYAFRTP